MPWPIDFPDLGAGWGEGKSGATVEVILVGAKALSEPRNSKLMKGGE
jgi:hypothetical protein